MKREANGSVFGFLLAGLAIGAALSALLAPRPGVETRRRIAHKCLDGVEATNGKLYLAGSRIHDLMDESQRRVTAVVAAGREMFRGAESRINGEER